MKWNERIRKHANELQTTFLMNVLDMIVSPATSKWRGSFKKEQASVSNHNFQDSMHNAVPLDTTPVMVSHFFTELAYRFILPLPRATEEIPVPSAGGRRAPETSLPPRVPPRGRPPSASRPAAEPVREIHRTSEASRRTCTGDTQNK